MGVIKKAVKSIGKALGATGPSKKEIRKEQEKAQKQAEQKYEATEAKKKEKARNAELKSLRKSALFEANRSKEADAFLGNDDERLGKRGKLGGGQ